MRRVWHSFLSERDLCSIPLSVLCLAPLLQIVQDIVFPENDSIFKFSGFLHVHISRLLNNLTGLAIGTDPPKHCSMPMLGVVLCTMQRVDPSDRFWSKVLFTSLLGYPSRHALHNMDSPLVFHGVAIFSTVG